VRKYEAPRVTTIGSVADLTQGLSYGSHLDADFPAGTPKGELTFS
jgi:hypothetical protein